MTVNVWAIAKTTHVKVAGLCYGVTYFEHFLARFIGVPWQDVRCRAIGVNHFTWITDMRDKRTGEDLYPSFREGLQATDPAHQPLSRHLHNAFGLFPALRQPEHQGCVRQGSVSAQSGAF